MKIVYNYLVNNHTCKREKYKERKMGKEKKYRFN